MKDMIIIIRPEKLEAVKKIMENAGCGGMTISSVMGCGSQRGASEGFGNLPSGTINLLPKIRVEIVVENEMVDDLVADLRDALVTGHVGDGKIFIRNVEDAVRIRTKQRGTDAL